MQQTFDEWHAMHRINNNNNDNSNMFHVFFLPRSNVNGDAIIQKLIHPCSETEVCLSALSNNARNLNIWIHTHARTLNSECATCRGAVLTRVYLLHIRYFRSNRNKNLLFLPTELLFNSPAVQLLSVYTLCLVGIFCVWFASHPNFLMSANMLLILCLNGSTSIGYSEMLFSVSSVSTFCLGQKTYVRNIRVESCGDSVCATATQYLTGGSSGWFSRP